VLTLSGCSDDAAPSADITVLPKDGAIEGGTDQGGDGPALDGSAKDGAAADGAMAVKAELIILHTNDLHSHLNGLGPVADYSPDTTGDDATLGGYARLAGQIAAERAAAGKTPVLLLDGGDFLMGTVFPWLGLAQSAELTEMGKMGYDAIAIGNHEFDWGPGALAGIISAAAKGGLKAPLMATNMKFDAASATDDALEALMTAGAIKRKHVKTLDNGLKVGFFGILGKNAAGVAPLAKPVTFDAAADAAKTVVAELRDVDKVDLVIAVSHSGCDADGTGEDVDLAKAVAGIDVIVSGHTHKAVPQPIQQGKTWIVQAGAYSRYLGKMVLSVHSDNSTSIKSYALIELDDKVKGDQATQDRIEGYVSAIDKELAALGLKYNTVLAETQKDLILSSFQESTLGNLVTDAYLSAAKGLLADPPQVAVETPGAIRDDIYKGQTGQIWFADAYRVLPLGIGSDLQPGYPLMSVYVHGKDLRVVGEVIALAETLKNNDYFLQIAGMRLEYDPNAIIFGRVKKLSLSDGSPIDLQDTTKCYHLVLNYYVYSLIGLLKTLGAPPIDPKEQDCKTVVTDGTKRFIDADPATPGLQELKGYQVLVKTLLGFPDTNANQLPDVPASYLSLDPKDARIKKVSP
jgi:5'-nucleotidase